MSDGGQLESFFNNLMRRQARDAGAESDLVWLERLRSDVARDREARWDSAGPGVTVVPGVTVGGTDVLVDTRDVTPSAVVRGGEVVEFPREIESRVVPGVRPDSVEQRNFLNRIGSGIERFLGLNGNEPGYLNNPFFGPNANEFMAALRALETTDVPIEAFAANAVRANRAQPGSMTYDPNLTLQEAYSEFLPEGVANVVALINQLGLPSVFDVIPGGGAAADAASMANRLGAGGGFAALPIIKRILSRTPSKEDVITDVQNATGILFDDIDALPKAERIRLEGLYDRIDDALMELYDAFHIPVNWMEGDELSIANRRREAARNNFENVMNEAGVSNYTSNFTMNRVESEGIDPMFHEWPERMDADYFENNLPENANTALTMYTGWSAGTEAVPSIISNASNRHLSKNLVEAVSGATGVDSAENGYVVLNQYLRTPQQWNDVITDSDRELLDAWTASMDEAFASPAAVVNTPQVVFRGGMTNPQMIRELDTSNPDALIGTTMSDAAFVSTSLSLPQAMSFMRTKNFSAPAPNSERYLLAITLPPGSRALPIQGVSEAAAESEVLLPRNTQIRITGYERRPDYIILEAVVEGAE